MSTQKVNLMNLNRAKMRDFFISIGEKPFRGDQLIKWIHEYGVTDFEEMSNLSKSLRAKLHESCEVIAPELKYEQRSEDGTTKWLIKLSCGNSVETVFIPENDRGTLCVSSQVGCSLNCDFCSTTRQGFNRNLSTAEIIGQVWLAVRRLSTNEGRHDRHVSNVVMMGMGEPLLNFDNVVDAMDIMLDDFAYSLSKYRVTLSTAGVVPKLNELKDVSPVALAVSLHAPNDELRDKLVPINKKYPIEVLLDACRNYFPADSKRQITMEYVMLDGINDQPEHAAQLAKVLRGVPAKVNLIPFNPFPGSPYKRSPLLVINKFRDILLKAGINTITRKTRGDDIDAACGQLVGKVKDRTRRSEMFKNIKVVSEVSAG